MTYVSRVASDWLQTGANRRVWRDTGSLVSVDLSGFTRLSERLAEADIAGAEQINAALNSQFAPLIDVVHELDGDVLQFGGDALLVWFAGQRHELRAVSAATEMQRSIKRHGRVSTSAGSVQLRMSSGVASGELVFAVIGRTHHELLTLGPVATSTVSLESAAGSGEVLVSPATASALPTTGRERDGGHLVRRPPLARDDPARLGALGHHQSQPVAAEAYAFLSPEFRAIVSAGVPTAEHRHASVAFVGIPGTDELAAPGREHELIEVLERVERTADRAVRDAGVCWTASDIGGDSFKMLFFAGAPIAAEDDAGRVLRTAAMFVEDCGSLGVKVGVNSGLAFAADIGQPRRRTFAIIGDTVNLAARLMGKAPPGSALVSPATIDAARSHWTTGPAVELHLKGKRAPVRAMPLLGAAEPVTAPRGEQATLIGRERELAIITSAVQHLGKGWSIDVVGDAGIGKSRLIDQVATQLVADGVTVVGVAASASAARTPYAAVRGLLASIPGAPAHELADPGVVVAGDDAGDVQDLVARRDRRHADIVDAIATAGSPAVLVIEDLQWLDDASHALLRQIDAARSTTGWVIVATRRADAEALPHDGSIRLRGLSVPELVAIARPAPGTGWLAPDIERLAAAVEGNPLYFAAAIRLPPGLTELGGGRMVEVLSARLDALDPLARRAARTLAVVGRPLEPELLAEIAGHHPGDLPLERFAGLLVAGPRGWWFGDAPLVDVARDGLSRRQRRAVHAAAASLLAAGRVGDAGPAELATHHAGAGDESGAWRWGRVAAHDLRSLGSLRDAVAMLEIALASIAAAPPDEVESVLVDYAELQTALGHFDRADAAVRSGWSYTGRSEPSAHLLLTRAKAAEQAGRFASGAQLAGRARRVAGATPVDLVDADLLAALMSHRRGSVRSAAHRCWNALAAAKRLGDDRRRAQAHLQLQLIRWVAGHRHAEAHSRCAEALFRRLDDRRGLGFLLLNRGVDRLNEGDWIGSLDDSYAAAEVLESAGYLVDAALARLNAGLVRIRQGRPQDALDAAEHIAIVFNGLGWPEGVAYLDVSVGAALAQTGRIDDGLERLAAAEAGFVQSHNVEFLGETRRQRAIALLRGRRTDEAEASVDAIDPAWFELDPVLEVGVAWLRGHAMLQHRDVERAEPLLRSAHELATRRGLAFDAAMVAWSLEAWAAHVDSDEQGSWRDRRLDAFERLAVEPTLPELPV